MDNFLEKPQIHRKWYKNYKILAPIIIVLIIGGIYAFNKDNSEVAGEKIDSQIKNVKTLILDSAQQNADEIKVSGVIKADTKVDVIAMANGTIRNINFEVGDMVNVGQLLVSIHDNNTLTNYGTAQANYSNTQQSFTSTQRLAGESVKQAEQGLRNAEVGLKSAQDNYDNGSELQKTSKQNSFNNAIISYYGYLNTIQSTLDQIEYILNVDEDYGPQLPGIAQTLGVKNSQSIRSAELAYLSAKRAFDDLSKTNVDEKNIVSSLVNIVNNLSLTKQAIDTTIVVLDNTVTSVDFSESSLMAQKTVFITSRSTIVTTQTVAQTNLQSLQNIDLNQKRELDSLQNALDASKIQLEQARIALNNAQEGKAQQLLSANSALNSSRGQLGLAGNQLSDLSITAPIFGQVTAKYVELGAQVTPGQKIVQVSQNDLVKIELELTSVDVYRIKLGQTAMVNGMFEGTVSHINPSADPMTKKVKIEIALNNIDKQLIPETFVDITIPIDGTGRSEFNAGRFFVPLKAVTITQTENFVFLNKASIAIKTQVTIGETIGDKVEIVSGLQNGDELIVEGNRLLEGDEKIRGEK